jgi:hypothetical protein
MGGRVISRWLQTIASADARPKGPHSQGANNAGCGPPQPTKLLKTNTYKKAVFGRRSRFPLRVATGTFFRLPNLSQDRATARGDRYNRQGGVASRLLGRGVRGRDPLACAPRLETLHCVGHVGRNAMPVCRALRSSSAMSRRRLTGSQCVAIAGAAPEQLTFATRYSLSGAE